MATATMQHQITELARDFVEDTCTAHGVFVCGECLDMPERDLAPLSESQLISLGTELEALVQIARDETKHAEDILRVAAAEGDRMAERLVADAVVQKRNNDDTRTGVVMTALGLHRAELNRKLAAGEVTVDEHARRDEDISWALLTIEQRLERGDSVAVDPDQGLDDIVAQAILAYA